MLMIETGTWSHENLAPSLEGFSMALFTRVFGWTKEEVETFLVDVRKEVNNPRIHAYLPMYHSTTHHVFSSTNTRRQICSICSKALLKIPSRVHVLVSSSMQGVESEARDCAASHFDILCNHCHVTFRRLLSLESPPDLEVHLTL